jgi:hypothetical protein
MDDLPTTWFIVLLKVQKRVALWLFFVPGLQGKQFAPEDEIKRSFTVSPDPDFAEKETSAGMGLHARVAQSDG